MRVLPFDRFELLGVIPDAKRALSFQKAPVGIRMGSDQADLLRNRKLRRLSLVAEPLGVDFGVFTVGDDLLQTFVDLVAQLCVALAEGDAEVLVFKGRIAGHVELFFGFCKA